MSRTYTNKRLARKKKTKEDLKKAEITKQMYYTQISKKYEEIGIIAEDIQKLMNCLLYRFKRKNIYYNLLHEIYLRDNTTQDFFNLCYIVAMELKDKTDFKTAYNNLKVELETETAVTRRRKQGQVFKVLHLSDMEELDLSYYDTSYTEIEKNADFNLLYAYLLQHLSKSQIKALDRYITSNKKIDSRTKRRILKNIDIDCIKKFL